VAGSFSLADAGLKFVLDAACGVAIGIAVGWIVAEIRKRINDTQVNVTISLLTGYAAFVPADAIGASGILATVTAGIYMGIREPQILPARTSLQGYFVWDILDFIINAILFVLIGLQLRAVINALSGYSAGTLAGYALAVTGVVRGIRLVWFFTVPYLVRAIAGGLLSGRGGWARGGVWWSPGAGCEGPFRSRWRWRCHSRPMQFGRPNRLLRGPRNLRCS
jgi:CPA1 family monovalent cation:H+ antiporter